MTQRQPTFRPHRRIHMLVLSLAFGACAADEAQGPSSDGVDVSGPVASDTSQDALARTADGAGPSPGDAEADDTKDSVEEVEVGAVEHPEVKWTRRHQALARI